MTKLMIIDDNPDDDNDGWGVCDGDCCDNNIACADPELVNPGAYEIDFEVSSL